MPPGKREQIVPLDRLQRPHGDPGDVRHLTQRDAARLARAAQPLAEIGQGSIHHGDLHASLVRQCRTTRIGRVILELRSAGVSNARRRRCTVSASVACAPTSPGRNRPIAASPARAGGPERGRRGHRHATDRQHRHGPGGAAAAANPSIPDVECPGGFDGEANTVPAIK